ncbi:MAG: glycosyltransferase family 4 protein [Deltaproteobacteria bacterium]|nr:glycosyltransferase family 4 protein [Deltaproteobacteria bacterium]
MNRHESRILFIAERYPPSVGGQQIYNFHLQGQLTKHLSTFLITPPFYLKFNLHKIWFLPYAVMAGILMGRKHHITHVHISSARLAPVGVIISRFLKVTISASVHGLDVILSGKSFLYRWLTPYCLAQFEHIICNSPATLAQAVQIGLRRNICHVVHCGVDGAVHRRVFPTEIARLKLQEKLNVEFGKKTIITTVGRLVKRKGAGWFIENVMPRLPEDHIYLVLGANGPEHDRIRQLIAMKNLMQRVFILPDAPDDLRDLVYDASDLFVMPNIRVAGQREGFGLVILEAGMHNVPVVASAIEGVTAAVRHGITGLLVKATDAEAFVRAIRIVLKWDAGSDKIRSAVAATYGWDKTYGAIAAILGLPGPSDAKKQRAN